MDAQAIIGRKPWTSREEELTSRAMEMALAPREVLQDFTNRPLFPRRRGFDTAQPTIEDVLNVSRWAGPQNNRWISGAPNMIQRAEIEDTSWAGGERYSMRSLW